MTVSVTLRKIVIKDVEGGEEYEVPTLRTAKEIAEIVEETEREEAIQHLSEAVWESYHQLGTKKTGND